MLFEFHRKQNSKNLNSVHATYLITGTKKAAQPNDGTHTQEDGEDTVMRSSPPFPSSSMPQPDDDEPAETIATRTIMLVKEENLNKARELFENIAGMHIYSLQANSPKDFHVLAGCNRRVAAEYASEDPLKDWKQYGVIQNQDVKRRTGKRSPPAPTTASKPEPVKPKATAAAAVKSSKAEINSALKPSAKNATTQQSNSMTTKATATKKQESSILKSFAKGTAKSKKSDSQQSSTATSPAPAPALEDVPMTGFSEDEDEDGDSGLPENLDAIKAPSGKSKKDRAAELEAMMDQEDEPMEDAATPKTEQDDGAIDRVNSQATYEPKETVAVENGKRRGRRRVMKKKTVKDEEGYLGMVTGCRQRIALSLTTCSHPRRGGMGVLFRG